MKKLLLAGAVLLGLALLAPPLPAQTGNFRPRLFPFHTAFGVGTTIDTNGYPTVLNVAEDYTGSSANTFIYGAQLYQAFKGTADNAGQVYGVAITGIANGTKNIGSVYGAYADAHSNGTGTPTSLTGMAGYGINYGSGATITDAVGGAFGAQNHAVNKTITNAIGVYISQLGFWSDTPVTNAYGLKIGSPTCFDAGCTTTSIRGLRIDDQTLGATATQYAFDVNGKFLISADGAQVNIDGLKTTGAATGKKVVCVDTATGRLYASSTGTDCSN